MTEARYGGLLNSLRLTFCTTMSISSVDGFVRNASMERLWSF